MILFSWMEEDEREAKEAEQRNKDGIGREDGGNESLSLTEKIILIIFSRQVEI